jgi:hypothetical protein
MRRHAPIIGILAALMLWGTGCSRPEKQVVAKVNQRPITQGDLWNALERADDGNTARRTLDSLIVRQLVSQAAEERNITVGPEELQKRLESLKDYVLANTGTSFEEWLEETGQTEDDILETILLQTLTARLVITDQDKQAYFEEHRDGLADMPHNNESVIFRQIVVASREEAEAIRLELTATEPAEGEEAPDFAAIAEERSLDAMTRARGGMVGWFVQGEAVDPNYQGANLPGDSEVVRQEAERRGISVSDEEVQPHIDELRELMPAQAGIDFDTFLQIVGMDEAAVANSVRMSMLSGKILGQVLFALEAGEISDPLPMPPTLTPPTAEGEQQERPPLWRIVKVERHLMPQEITLESNMDVIEDMMLQDQMYQMRYQEFFDELRATADIEVVSPRYKSLGEMYRMRREARQQQAVPSMPAIELPEGMDEIPMPMEQEAPSGGAGQ